MKLHQDVTHGLVWVSQGHTRRGSTVQMEVKASGDYHPETTAALMRWRILGRLCWQRIVYSWWA
jgi:hypothetical protein